MKDSGGTEEVVPDTVRITAVASRQYTMAVGQAGTEEVEKSGSSLVMS